MIAKMPISPTDHDSRAEWPDTPTWFRWRPDGYRVCFRADGVTIPARISEETATGLSLQAQDPGGLLAGRLFASQLVQVVNGKQRITGTIRAVHGRGGSNCCVQLSFASFAARPDRNTFVEDDEIIVCAC